MAESALALAAHAARAAALLRDGTVLDWPGLCRWPAWALPGAEHAPQWLSLGALWHGAALARCIDGERLRAAEALLGPAVLEAVLQRRPALPGPAQLPADPAQAWPRAGRALALASLADPGLRAAVAAAWGLAPAPLPVAEAAQALAWSEALA